MKFKNKKMKILTLFLVACQSVLFTLLAAFFVGRSYNHTLANYPNVKKDTFYLKDVKKTQENNTLNFLTQEAAEKKLLIIRTDQTLTSEGNSSGDQLGIIGDIDKHPVTLKFAGHEIIAPSLLKKLLQSEDAKTIGNALDYESIADTPNFAGGKKLTVFKLSDLIKRSGNINGTYQVIGLNSKMRANFLSSLARVTKEPKKNLQKQLGGSEEKESLLPTILAGGLVLSTLGLLILFLLDLVQSLSLLGDLVLLGWSKVNFLIRLYVPYIIAALMMSIVSVPLGIILSGKYLSFWSLFFLINLLNMGLIAFLTLIASALVLSMSSLDILKHKFPCKALMSFSIFGYLMLSVGIIFGCYALDGPLQTLNDTYQMSKSWHDVSHLTILKNSQFASDGQTHEEAMKMRCGDFYSWYKDIYRKRGVYLANSTVYTRQTIRTNLDNGFYMPSRKPFVNLTVSPSYLQELGVKVPGKDLVAAEKGKRLYLFPSYFSSAKIARFKKWLRKDDTESINSTDIPTVFNKKRQFIFDTYKADKTLFTWSTKTSEPLKMREAIFLVATPANMTYFESDNLSAQGLGGLVKFDTNKMSAATKKKIFTNQKIKVYKPSFITIGSFIKGLQKDLSYTLYLFGVVGVVLLILSLILVYTIIRIYQVSQQELFNVKKFLGYSVMNIYSKPLIFLTIVFVIELLATLLLRTRAGTLVIIIKFILQAIFILLYLHQSSIKQLLANLKEDQ